MRGAVFNSLLLKYFQIFWISILFFLNELFPLFLNQTGLQTMQGTLNNGFENVDRLTVQNERL